MFWFLGCQGMPDPSSLTREPAGNLHPLHWKMDHWTTREVPEFILLIRFYFYSLGIVYGFCW